MGALAALLLLAGSMSSLSTAALAQGADNGIETESEAWERLDQGDLPIGAEPLRQLVDESDLVVLGSALTSVPKGDGSESVTDLRLDLVLKGRETAQNLRVVHLTPREGEDTAFAPGDLLLAFLHRRGDGAYEPVDATFGMKAPGTEALAAYRERIETFLGLSRGSGMNPADLAEWLVATTEEPLTRKAGASELLASLDALAEMGRARKAPESQVAGDLRSFVASRLAAGRALEPEPIPALVGAFLTAEQKERLEDALESTRTLDRADLTLYEIVKTWDRDEALAWFVRQLRDVEPAASPHAPADLGVEIMDALARELARPDLEGLVKTAQDRLIAIYSDPSSFASEAGSGRRQLREAEVERTLLRDFRVALAAN